MTDARFPERWLNDRRLMQLPAPAFRAFMTSLAWSVANRTDGVITIGDLVLIPGAVRRDAAVLVKAGLWEEVHDGLWVIQGFGDTQTTRAALEAADEHREKERLKKARQRAEEKAAGAAEQGGDARAGAAVPGDVPGDVPGVSPRTGQDRPGRTKGNNQQTGNSRARDDGRPLCAVPGCGEPARRSCRTCAGHMARELEFGEPG